VTTLATTAADYKTPQDRIPEAQDLVLRCIRKGLTPKSIAYRLHTEHTVGLSWRTIYRWAKGEHEPQQPADMTALQRVAAKHLGAKPDVL
jgi:hypothetical protein